jgi:hypothetical protein
MSDNQLIKISTTDLVQRTGQQIAIANKILTLSDISRIQEFALLHPDFFCKMISVHYPLSMEIMGKYKDKWNWYELSSNDSIAWLRSKISKYYSCFYWNKQE